MLTQNPSGGCAPISFSKPIFKIVEEDLATLEGANAKELAMQARKAMTWNIATYYYGIGLTRDAKKDTSTLRGDTRTDTPNRLYNIRIIKREAKCGDFCSWCSTALYIFQRIIVFYSKIMIFIESKSKWYAFRWRSGYVR